MFISTFRTTCDHSQEKNYLIRKIAKILINADNIRKIKLDYLKTLHVYIKLKLNRRYLKYSLCGPLRHLEYPCGNSVFCPILRVLVNL